MVIIRADKLKVDELRKSKIRRFWTITVGSLLLVGLLALAALERYFYHDTPQLPADTQLLWSMGKETSYVLLDKDGQPLARRGPRYGTITPVSEMPSHLVQAFIAMEDRRYYEHDGVDETGIARAAWTNFRAGKTMQGGSTITQQVVRLLFLSPRQTIRRKLQEMRLAKALEKRLGKDEILSLYLNRIYLGNRSYGVVAASQRYFQKSLTDISLYEAAMLAALAKAPGRIAPHLKLAQSQSRAELVLQAMFETEIITFEQLETALANPAILDMSAELPDHGYIFDLAIERAKALTGGRVPDMIIRTTIDPVLQEAAQSAVQQVINSEGKAKKASQIALVSTSHNGAVRAMVGGMSYEKSNFNRAVSAKRQPGSAFKTIVYAAAMETGLMPASVRRDAPIEIAGWSPGNYGGGYRGRVTIREAFRRSINTIAAQVTDEIGAGKVARLAGRLGISGELLALPSIALGAQEVSLWDLTQAYGVFANEGKLQENYIVQNVYSSSGSRLYQRPEMAARHVYDEVLASEMTGMMREVVRSGTGTRAKLANHQAAGKTGTSQDWRDAWFVGFTRYYVTGVWVGNDDNSAMKRVTGGDLPAKTWKKYMQLAHSDLTPLKLNAPEPPVLSETEEGLSAFYLELASIFGELEVEIR